MDTRRGGEYFEGAAKVEDFNVIEYEDAYVEHDAFLAGSG
jgi:hypothetical protein